MTTPLTQVTSKNKIAIVCVVITLIIRKLDISKCPHPYFVCQHIFQELSLDSETCAITILQNGPLLPQGYSPCIFPLLVTHWVTLESQVAGWDRYIVGAG